MADEPREDLHCSLCSRVYKNPRVLPCLHSFCEECLEKQKERHHELCEKGKAAEQSLTCPITSCQMSISPTLKPEDLPKNLWLESKIGIDTKLKELFEGTCEVCEEKKKAETLCAECWLLICCDCKTGWHQRNRAYQSHTLVPITEESIDTLKAMVMERLSKTQPCFCSEHHERLSECSNCGKLSCSLCQLNDKCEDHECNYLPDVVQATKDKLTSAVQSLAGPLKKLQDALGECETTKNKVSTRKREVEEEINTVFSELISTLTKQKEELLKECHAIAQSKSTHLDLQMEQLQRLKHQMEHCSEVVSTACSSYTPTQLLAVDGVMTTRINSLNEKFKKKILQPCTTDGIMATFPSHPQLGAVSKACYPPLSVLELPAGKPVKCIFREEKKLRLVMCNEEGEKMYSTGGDTVEATLTSTAKTTSSPTTAVEVTDNHDGTYQLSFTPHSVGDYQLSVNVGGYPILGSPFKVFVDTEWEEVWTLLRQSLQRGEQRFLVDYHWMHRWKVFIGHFEFGMWGKGKEELYPGPVDNSKLFKDCEQGILKDNLKKGVDFDHLSKPLWEKLITKYGLSPGSRPIVRDVAPSMDRYSSLDVEVYPIALRVCVHPHENVTVTCFCSGNDTVRDVEAKICTLFNIPECRLWRDSWAVENKDWNIADTQLDTQKVAVLEVKSVDGKWPKKQRY